MTPPATIPASVFGLSDQFLSSVIGALVGALVAGAISLLVANWVFRSERKARADEIAASERRREIERAEDKQDAILRMRVKTVTQIIELVRRYGSTGGYGAIPLDLQNATNSLLLDRTKASSVVNNWVLMKLKEIERAANDGNSVTIPRTTHEVSAALIGWIREEDEPHMLEQMRKEMAAHGWTD